MDTKKLKENIHRERKLKGMTIEQVCRSAGRSRYWLNQLDNPKLNTIADIAAALGCTCADLMKE